MTQAANSALYSARLRFVEGLPARAEELSSTAERLARDPGDHEAAAMLRRRLHALLASAQVFEERALSLAVQDLIARLDVAQRAERPFTRQESDAVAVVVASLPTYVRPSLQPPAAYSDVRELLATTSERAASWPAADSGQPWRPAGRDRAAGASAEPAIEAPSVLPKIENELDDYVPAALVDSTPPPANDRVDAIESTIAQQEQGYASGVESTQLGGTSALPVGISGPAEASRLGASIAFELAEGRADFDENRPLPPRARRIIALSALQPGPGGISAESESPETLAIGLDAGADPDSSTEPVLDLSDAEPAAPEVATDDSIAPADAPEPEGVLSVAVPQDAAVTEALREASVRPLPQARESSSDLAAVAAALFAGDSISVLPLPKSGSVSELSPATLPSAEVAAAEDESWSQAVAEASEELAAYRDSLQPDPIPEIDIEDAGEGRASFDTSVAASEFEDDESDTSPRILVDVVSDSENTGEYTELAPAGHGEAERQSRDYSRAGESNEATNGGVGRADPASYPTRVVGSGAKGRAARRRSSSAGLATNMDTVERRAVRPPASFSDVIADAGRAGLGGGAAALESVDLEVGTASEVAAFRQSDELADGADTSAAWLEPHRADATTESRMVSESAANAPIERNSIAAGRSSISTQMDVPSERNSLAVSGDADEDDDANQRRTGSTNDDFDAENGRPTLIPGLEPEPAFSRADESIEDPITLDMRPPEIAEWADSRTELHERSQSLPRSSGSVEAASEDAEQTSSAEHGLDPVSSVLPIAPQLSAAPLGGQTAGLRPPEEAADARDPDADSSATTELLGGATFDLDSPQLTAAVAISQAADADPDADSSASASLAAPPAARERLELPRSAVAASEADSDIVEPDFSDETSPGVGPVLLKQTVSGLLPKPGPDLVLLVADAACATRVRANLPADSFGFVHAETADEAVRSLHENKPDLVLVSADLASLPDVDLLRRLKTDPLAPVRRVQVLLPEAATFDQNFLQQIGADGAVNEPLTASSLAPFVRENAGNESSAARAREGSIEEIAAQIAEEIRRGIAESLRTGKSESMRVGDGSQLMAAAWSAIGRVRSHLADHDRGRTGNEDEGRRSASLLPNSASEAARAPSIHPSQLLAGCRVLVADDDPAVLWFFVGLLREASAHVLQAHNGREALELARRKQPHVIVSDILMPKLDGFGLCRELKRDALLSQVPVILLSWKDDLLQRMRELDAGAAGYLRKEAGSQQILAQLTDVLQPRTRLVTKLRSHGDLSGSVAELGALSILELVAAERPDAHIAVRDAWNLFEIDIRGGRRLSVTRTAADGAFTRGEKALMQLLGLAGGEFHVSASSAPLKAPIQDSLDRALAAAGRRLSALLDAVSDARLLRVCLIAFDDDVLQSLLSAPSTRMHEVVALFRTGNATAEGVLREGQFAPGELEDYLRELARCVAITGVWDSRGEDLVAAAQRERETPQLALLSSTLPPRSGGGWSVAPEAPRARRSSVPPSIVASSAIALTKIDGEADAVATIAAPTPDSVASLEIEAGASTRVPLDSDTVPEAMPPSAASEKIQTQPGIGPESVPPELPDWLKSPSTSTSTALATTSLELAMRASLSNAPTEPPTAQVVDEHETDAVSKAELESFDLPIPSTFARALPDRADGLRLAGTLIVLAAVGYFGWQQFAASDQTRSDQTTRIEASKSPPNILAPAPVPPPPTPRAQPRPAPQPAQPTIQNTQFGKVLPFVDTSRGVAVAPDQGLLVIELSGSDPAPYIRVGTRELGKAPLAVALPAGRHELVVRSGKSTSFRYLIVRAGETRIVSVPLAEL